jgi:hypothetical protein
MPTYALLLIGVLVAALAVWSLTSALRQQRGQHLALDRLGFRPCPEESERLAETVTGIENNQGYRYEVKEPRRLEGRQAIYYYVKVRHSRKGDDVVAEEEVLFPLKRPSAAGLLLVVKPSSLPAGMASRILGTVATADWDAQPDHLKRLELPADLKDTNLVGALAPPGASLYELVDTATLSVVQGLGDAGGMLVRFREGCALWPAPARGSLSGWKSWSPGSGRCAEARRAGPPRSRGPPGRVDRTSAALRTTTGERKRRSADAGRDLVYVRCRSMKPDRLSSRSICVSFAVGFALSDSHEPKSHSR